MLSQCGRIKNENGFVLALAIFMLAICSMIGIAAMMTSTTEVDIAINETVYRQTLYEADAGPVVAADTLITSDPQSTTWNDNSFLDSDNNVKIIDGNFLLEGRDSDTNKHWNYWGKYASAPSDKKDDYKPIDDLLVAGSNPSSPYVTDTNPDIIIRTPNQFTINIDVDKVASRYIGGSGAEFGAGAEGMGASAFKIIYNYDCMASTPGRNIEDTAVPKSEVVLGYRYVP